MSDLRRFAEGKRVLSTFEGEVLSKKSGNDDDTPNMIIEEQVQDRHGNITTRKYLRGKFLGKGGFAKCFEVRELSTNRIFAAKIVAKNTLFKSRAKNKLTAEIKIHRSLSQNNVVKFEHFFEDEDNVYILLEMCNQKSMMELLKRRTFLTEMEVRYYLLQVLVAVKYMHSCRVIHRDLKLGNLFLNNMQIKIGDFGLAAKLDHDGQRKKTICGTPNYIAPEILECSNGHSYEVDVWSIGVIMYTLIIGKPPFETSDIKITYKRIKANIYKFPEGVAISESAKALIRKILHTVPEARPSLDEIMEHPFFVDNYTPITLPVSALHSPPSSPHKSLRPTSLLLTSSATLSSQSKSPSRIPLSERTNTNPNGVVNHINNQVTVSPHRNTISSHLVQPRSPAKTAIVEKEDIEEHTHKLKFFDEKCKENDLQTLFLKTRLTEDPNPNTRIVPPHQSTLPQQAPLVQPPTKFQNEGVVDQEHGHLRLMHRKLTESFMATGTAIPRQPVHDLLSAPTKPSVWVAKWVDYSNKYGLGYLLSNGVSGACFNDSTKMMTVNQRQCEFIGQSCGDTFEERRIFNMSPPPGQPHPHEINKKITLLKYFRQFLSQNSKDEGAVSTSPISNLSYIKKWKRTKRAIVFRLSNNTIQLDFLEDHTKIILSAGAQEVTYVDKQQNFSSYFLSAICNTNTGPDHEELVDRLKFTTDILYDMINHKKASKK